VVVEHLGQGPCHVALVGSVRVYREALAAHLQGAALSVVLCNGTAEDDVALLSTIQPAVVLLDVSNLDNLHLVPTIVRYAPGARVVAIGVRETEQDVVGCAQAGVCGYVFVDACLTDLVKTILNAVTDSMSFPPAVARILIGRLAQVPVAGPLSGLTCRELEIVECLRAGFTNKEIAKHLGIQVATVKNHMHNLLQKLRVHRRAAVASALSERSARVQAPARTEVLEVARSRDLLI